VETGVNAPTSDPVITKVWIGVGKEAVMGENETAGWGESGKPCRRD